MKKKQWWTAALALVLALSCLLLTGCGGSSSADPFTTYSEAYKKVMANAGFDADLSATLNMDGQTQNATGNFKVDNSGDNTLLYLEVKIGNETITQFSDGEYLYVDARGNKSKYPLGQKQEESTSANPPGEDQGAPEFTVEDFLKEFASFLEAGKIQELGLLSPLESSWVSQTTVDGDTYHLTVKDTVLSKMTETLSSSVTVNGESVTVEDLTNFTYDAVVKDGYVTSVTYAGTMNVNVPASVTSTGSAETYPLDLKITATFNNPGEKVSVSIPSTDGY